MRHALGDRRIGRLGFLRAADGVSGVISSLGWLILLLGLTPRAIFADEPAPHRLFPAARPDIDDLLKRSYDRDVPMGTVGDRLWASSPQGWAFADDVHWLYLTNLKAFDLEVRDEDGPLRPTRAKNSASSGSPGK